jgi:pimeloyl-ACP methyl ester carboxylesterase
MIKVILWMVVIVMSGFVALCALLYTRQRSMLYYPTPEVNSSAAQAVRLSHQGQSLKVWYVPGDTDQALIYFGGNAEDVSLNISQFKRLFPRHSLYLHNYRGYGGSSGQPTEEGLYSDAMALYEYVQKKHQNIAVMGRSLGTGIAVYLASHKKVKRVVLVTPYDSMVNVASHYYPFIPVSLLLKDRYESIKRAGMLDMAVLVIVADRDEVIPRSSTDGLVSVLAPENTEVTIISGATHNSIGSFPQYEESLRTFLSNPSAQ